MPILLSNEISLSRVISKSFLQPFFFCQMKNFINGASQDKTKQYEKFINDF